MVGFPHMKSSQLLGKRIRILRRQAGLTQSELAEKSGLSDNFIGLIERGERQLTVPTVQKFSKALGIKLGDFFIEEEQAQSLDSVLRELEQLLKKRDLKDAQLLLSIAKRIFENFPK